MSSGASKTPILRNPSVRQVLIDGQLSVHRFPGTQPGRDVLCIDDAPIPDVQACGKAGDRGATLLRLAIGRERALDPAPTPPSTRVACAARFRACVAAARAGPPGKGLAAMVADDRG
eukprot:78671-Alexandrium_andersonii.AAC.1